MLITAFGRTDVGRKRPDNEDAFAIDAVLGLVVVADGMGGHARGEVAAALTVETICEFTALAARDPGLAWPVEVDRHQSPAANCLRAAIHLANARVRQTAADRDDLAGMGTTVVAGLVRDGRLTYAGVGDSRIYLARAGEVRQLTRDDSWIETAVSAGLVAAADRLTHPLAHVLVQAIGLEDDVDVEVSEVVLEPDDRVLLCSDGLTAALADDQIGGLLSAHLDGEAACRALVDAANDAGGPDNVTVVLARMAGVALAHAEGRRRWGLWRR